MMRVPVTALGSDGAITEIVVTASGNLVLHVQAQAMLREPGDVAPVMGERFLIGLAGADGTHRWRQQLAADDRLSLAVDGDDTIVVTRQRLDRRDDAGVVVVTVPVRDALFADRDGSYGSAPERGAVHVNARGLVVGTPPAPRYLRGVDLAGNIRFDATAVGPGQVDDAVATPGIDGGTIVFGGFLGEIELTSTSGSATLRADAADNVTLPFEAPRSGDPMPFLASLTADGALRGTLLLPPDSDTHHVFDVAVAPNGEVIVLHGVEDRGRVDEVMLSAFAIP